jgi:hypothetical protein
VYFLPEPFALNDHRHKTKTNKIANLEPIQEQRNFQYINDTNQTPPAAPKEPGGHWIPEHTEADVAAAKINFVMNLK